MINMGNVNYDDSTPLNTIFKQTGPGSSPSINAIGKSLLTDDGTTLKYNGVPVAGGGASGITGSGTINKIPKFTAAGVIGNSSLDDGVTTAGVVTSTEPVAAPYVLPTVIYSAAGTPLPAATNALKGARAVVSDATSPTFLGAYVSGGAVIAPVLCTGSGWVTA
jgi:hypothetical protein